MSWVKVYVHVVFTTKNRKPLLKQHLRDDIFKHIQKNAKEKGIFIDHIGGYHDHIHCLISLNKEIAISKTIQLIKGESSHWINKNNLIKEKFEYQDDYWMVGVSESHLDAVRQYIQNQERHHKTTSFDQEIKKFVGKFGWSLQSD